MKAAVPRLAKATEQAPSMPRFVLVDYERAPTHHGCPHTLDFLTKENLKGPPVVLESSTQNLRLVSFSQTAKPCDV